MGGARQEQRGEGEVANLESVMQELSRAGFQADGARAQEELSRNPTMTAGDAACRAVPRKDWARARGTLGLIVDQSAGMQACGEAIEAMRAHNVSREIIDAQLAELDYWQN